MIPAIALSRSRRARQPVEARHHEHVALAEHLLASGDAQLFQLGVKALIPRPKGQNPNAFTKSKRLVPETRPMQC